MANSKGITICFRDSNKHWHVSYQSKAVQQIQLHGKAKYQQLEKPVFNKIQQRLYAETVYGLTAYTPEQLAVMPAKKKLEIIKTYKRVQLLFNKIKQEVIDEQVNKLLLGIFHKSTLIKKMCEIKGYDRSRKDKHTFKELGITQEKLAQILVHEGFLPANFFQLH